MAKDVLARGGGKAQHIDTGRQHGENLPPPILGGEVFSHIYI